MIKSHRIAIVLRNLGPESFCKHAQNCADRKLIKDEDWEQIKDCIFQWAEMGTDKSFRVACEVAYRSLIFKEAEGSYIRMDDMELERLRQLTEIELKKFGVNDFLRALNDGLKLGGVSQEQYAQIKDWIIEEGGIRRWYSRITGKDPAIATYEAWKSKDPRLKVLE